MQPKKRTRASHPKVRTGCHTCKARRVKCDEQRPSCQKCLSTGRKCEGYKNNQEWVIVVAPPPPVTDGFKDDRSRRHFDYFRTQAVYELSWFFDGRNWGNLVLQESHSSAAIRHAVIALACSHEDFKDNLTVEAQAPQYAYAAQHYSKAIKNLIKETKDDAHESRLRALMCGLLFISIEVLRGNTTAALNHLDGCLKIVKEAQSSGMPSFGRDFLESEAHLFRDIIPMYSRLDVQSTMVLGRQPQSNTFVPKLWDPSRDVRFEEPPHPSFSTTFEALENLFWLGDRVHDYTGWIPCHKMKPCTSRPDTHTDKIILYGQFMNWENAVQPLLNSIEHAHDYDKLVVMRIHHRTMMTLYESSLDLGESMVDNYRWTFEDIVNFTTELQERPCLTDDEGSTESDSSFTAESGSGESMRPNRSRTSTSSKSPGAPKRQPRSIFVLDAGVVFSLYWTALKCRDGLIRRRAISLLEGSAQEGVWIGPIQATIAKRVVEIEEGQPYEQYPALENMKSFEDVPAYMRVHNVTTDIMKAKRSAKMVLLRRTNELEDEWQETVEWVSW